MELKLKQLGAMHATQLSHILKEYSCEALIKTGRYCIDGKSVLGILSAMEGGSDDITLEINELDNKYIGELGAKLAKFCKQ
jgi:phosphotransferase system HPr-like phosphotransfer protein